MPSEEVEEYRSAFHNVDYKYIPRTLRIHPMVSGQGNEYIYYWDTLYCYSSWLNGDLRKFLWQYVTKTIPSSSLFLGNGKRRWMMMTNFTTWTTKKLKRFRRLSSLWQKLHNLFRMGTYSHQNHEDHDNYLLKLLAKPYKTVEMMTDDYHHLILNEHTIMLLKITSN